MKNYEPYPEDFTKIYVNGQLIPRIVVCAANKLSNGLIICGNRHWAPIMHNVVDALRVSTKDHEQGFIDQYGYFITRKEAKIIAVTNNQKLRMPFDSEYAYSENFY